MTATRSSTLDLARFIAIFLVTLCHCPVTDRVERMPVIFLVTDVLGFGVPALFFLLSGYLGASKIHDRTVRVGRYATEKLRTLAVPFLFWNVFLLCLIFLAKAMGVEAFARSSGAYFNVEPTARSVVSACLGIGRAPIVYQFWFLRDLIVVSLLGIVVCRSVPRVSLWLGLLFLVPIPVASSMGYYLLGYSLQPHRQAWQSLTWPWLIGYCLAWLLLGWGILAGWIVIPSPLRNVGSAIFLFCLAALISRSALGRCLATLGSATFFVYAAHEPTQTVIAKVWLMRGWPAYGSVFFFLLIPSIVFPSCILVHHVLQRLAPRFLAYVTGGR